MVLVDELLDLSQAARERFLADVRIKASIDLPLIGSIYEAVSEPALCFVAHELLAGATFQARLDARETHLPARLAHHLRRVSEAQIQLETLGHASQPLQLVDIFLDDHGVVRLANGVVVGIRDPESSEVDIVYLGRALVPLIATGQPGASRLQTLLGWMRGEGLEKPLNWEQTRDFCLQIEHQLADTMSSLLPTASLSKVRKKPILTTALLTAAALVVILAVAFRLRPPVPDRIPRLALPNPVEVPAGNYPTHDGLEITTPGFMISAHEVTIGQYEEFVEILTTLGKDQREGTFDRTDQPKEKTSHLPDEWSALLAAAKAGGIWKGVTVSLDSPVVGVDWWDVMAYAEWKQARVPTQDEWFAALSLQVQIPAAIVPAPWIPVNQPTADRTPAGLLGMSGSVCEWTSERAPNPANPLGKQFWVIAGGSYLKTRSSALSREWVDDPALRRPDLGFRLIFDRS